MEKRLHSLPLKDVTIKDAYWSRYIDRVPAGLEYQWKALNDQLPDDTEKSYCIRNFKIAAGLEKGEFGGLVFQDNDLAKWLEAVAYRLESADDPELEAKADEAIDLIEKAQRADGYLNTYYLINRPGEQFKSLCEHHELFCAGHYFEAGVAYYEATGKDKLLKVACRYADYIESCFGEEEGKISGYCGHPEIELALVRLYRATGEERYLKLSKFFIDRRGEEPNYFAEEKARPDYEPAFPDSRWFDDYYFQIHAPVRKQLTAEGHAVRLGYLFSGVADVAYETGDETLLETAREVFNNIAEKRMYVTGSVGSSERGERFTADYDLPNDSNYSESCASVALAMFAKRMLEIEHDGKYAEVMERALYNTILAGISQEGTRFFYVNPLEVIPEIAEKNLSLNHVKTERQKWFGCACCPPNIIRTLASLQQYVYSTDDENLFVNLLVSNETDSVICGHKMHLSLKTRYPFDGKVELKITCEEDADFTLGIRLPQNSFLDRVFVDGCMPCVILDKGYLKVKRNWKGTHTVQIMTDLPVRRVYANPMVRADAGKVCLMKGPVVYCLEEADNGKNLGALELPDDAVITETYNEDILGGTIVLSAKGVRVSEANSHLYSVKPPKKEEATLRFVPYCYWNNRGKGEMMVWIRREIK